VSELSAPEPSRLADMSLVEAVTAAGQTRVREVSAEGCTCIVVLDAERPVAAVPTSVLRDLPPERSLLAIASEGPPTVIADAAASVARSLASWAFQQLPADGAAVIVDDAGACRVWAGEDLAEVRDLAGRRSAIDTRLPGDEVRIPRLCRSCRYSHRDEECPAIVSFAEYPEPMPPCPNPASLSPHQFIW
jgi:hypothetical protein